jgi:hypothetical protein
LNYGAFRACLRAPLVTVELGYGEYELDPADAEVLVRLPGRDRLWQKGALTELPPECHGVVWLDCDVAFFNDGWPELTLKALERWPLVQPFDAFHQIALSDSCDPEIPLGRVPDTTGSLASRMLDGSVPPSIFSSIGSSRRFAYAPGFAWAARRDVVEDIGLYDALILGCGDKAMASAAYGRFDDTVGAYRMSEPHANRAPYTGFERFGFDPRTDVAVDKQGAWRWASDKPGLQRYVAESLRDRCHDCDEPPPHELLGQAAR